MATAYVLINCDLGKEENIIENLRHIDFVKEIQGTFGAYDVVAKIENDDRDRIRETITWNIRKMDSVRSTLTLMGIDGQN